ncbi:major capsid protein P2 [Rhodocyclus gracilis]|uniref:Uncharacterized protein n=1 Tax=Rhodocyclus tenuis TaxID=1066 RepID=A0A6L5JTZ4_RHOTE|nr:major capsid protein P2 [Rhodocyclus gracilis]MQY50837.1 hypothetical protein [Rhodocyclus gracilis]
MIIQQIPPFNNVVNTGVATVKIPKYALTLTRLVLVLGGTTFTKAMITDIKLKLGVRTVYNITGTFLDRINKYKGLFDDANHLTIDFTERDAPTLQGKELGGYDLPNLDDMTVEITITGATAPTLTSFGYFTASQGNDVIHKILYFPTSSNVAGKFPVNFNPMGALVKRVHFFYAGTSFSGATPGNLNRLEVKKNGLAIWDLGCYDARFSQQEYRKVPQANTYVYDPIVDNNQSGVLVTADAKSLEFNTFLTAADSIQVYVEMLDKPNNA